VVLPACAGCIVAAVVCWFLTAVLCVQGVTIPSQRRYVRYWAQVCGRISPVPLAPAAGPTGTALLMDDQRRLTEVLIDRENKAKLQEIGV
jgi:hypothetical protein